MRRPMRALCAAVAEMTFELRRPPSSGELAARLGRFDTNTRRSIAIARHEGWLTPWPPGRPQFTRSPLRLTPAARLELGLPILTYLAWPLPASGAPGATYDRAVERGRALVERVNRGFPGAVAVSPYLATWTPEMEPRLAAAAGLLAASCDACIVYRDELLLGRPDVAAARAAQAHVVLIGEIDTPSADPWRPTYPPGRRSA